jgi:hypothetical protein
MDYVANEETTEASECQSKAYFNLFLQSLTVSNEQ